MTDEQSKVATTLRAHCSQCNGVRNCEIMGHHAESGTEHEFIDWRIDWYILRCRGCDYVFAQTASSNSEEVIRYHDHAGEEIIDYNEKIDTWPAREKRELPEWFQQHRVDTDLSNTRSLNAALKELYGALNAGLSVLASIGIRTAFDISAEVLGVDPAKTFADKMKELVTLGHIQAQDEEDVETLVDAGSASAHRGWKPKVDDLHTLMDALEDFIYGAMVLPSRKREKAAKMAEIKGKVPKRQRPKKNQPPQEG